jgi:hypothetical protein
MEVLVSFCVFGQKPTHFSDFTEKMKADLDQKVNLQKNEITTRFQVDKTTKICCRLKHTRQYF